MNTENEQLFDEHQKKLYDEKAQMMTIDIDEFDELEKIQTPNSDEIKKQQDDFVFNELGEGKKDDGTVKEFLEDEELDIIKSTDKKGRVTEIITTKNYFEIEKVEILKPYYKDTSGNIIPPIENKDKNGNITSQYYNQKLKVTVKDRPYNITVSGIRWFKNNNAFNPDFRTEAYMPNLDTKFVSEINQLYWDVCDLDGFDKTKKDEEKILSKKEFIERLKGKKVKLFLDSGVFEKDSRKIDWTKIAIFNIKN